MVFALPVCLTAFAPLNCLLSVSTWYFKISPRGFAAPAQKIEFWPVKGDFEGVQSKGERGRAGGAAQLCERLELMRIPMPGRG